MSTSNNACRRGTVREEGVSRGFGWSSRAGIGCLVIWIIKEHNLSEALRSFPVTSTAQPKSDMSGEEWGVECGVILTILYNKESCRGPLNCNTLSHKRLHCLAPCGHQQKCGKYHGWTDLKWQEYSLHMHGKMWFHVVVSKKFKLGVQGRSHLVPWKFLHYVSHIEGVLETNLGELHHVNTSESSRGWQELTCMLIYITESSHVSDSKWNRLEERSG